MINQTNSILHILLSVLFFPVYFQQKFVQFSWGQTDPMVLMLLKRVFLLLPVLALIAACWITIAAFITVIFRHDRQRFVVALVVTWWDLGKAIVTFWGGILRFLFSFVYSLIALLKVIVVGLWSIIKDLVLLPFRLLSTIGRGVVGSSVPWIAVTLTLFWCIIEATIFTYVMTPLVIDAFSNITGSMLAENAIRIPLFIFLFFIVLGSYAVLSTFMEQTKKKNVSSLIGIGMIEIVVLFVEVIFFYREFVASLIPWFAQYSPDFSLGIWGTLAVSCFVWFSVRSLSWFLFASYGTPTLLQIIQGRGLEQQTQKEEPKSIFNSTPAFSQVCTMKPTGCSSAVNTCSVPLLFRRCRLWELLSTF
ncbi:MAG: hypothetical protein U5R06_14380 [candidate division KSB1 bacterium]|nr:hypothetical protein [candidate division KSB1 bacterium]